MKRLLALGATAAILALGVLGVLPQPAASSSAFPPQRPTRVLVLGDSVMKGAEASVIAALPGREVVFDSEVNRSTATGADIVAQRGGDWDVAVVFLGHNDGGSPGAFQPAARSILEQLGGARRVAWLTIHEVRPYYPAVNQYIAGLQPEYPNLRIGDWNAIANAHPEGVAGDGLHLNGTGASLMAGLVTEQVQTAELEWAAAMARLATTTTTAAPTTTTTAPPTTTSSTTTTEAPSTTTTMDPTERAVLAARTQGNQSDRGDADQPQPQPASSNESSVLPYVAAVTIVVLVVGGLFLWRRKRVERADQAAADTAG